MADRSSYWIAGAVWVGSLVLVGIPTAALVAGSLDAALGAADVSGPPALSLAIGVLALSVGLKVATELAHVRLHGIARLHRGSTRRVLARHVVLAIPALFVIGYLGALVVALVRESETAGGPLVLALLASTLLVFGLVLARTVQALLAGRQEAMARQPEDRAAE